MGKFIPAQPAQQGNRIDAPDRRDPASVNLALMALCRRFGDRAVLAGLHAPMLKENWYGQQS